jgi:predicted GIY-YIG superfamily endonuclease
MYTIYLIENDINDKKYVGITSRPLQVRFNQHFTPSNLHSAFSEFIQKRESFSIKELDTANSKEEALNKESKYIRELKTLAPNGFNRSDSKPMFYDKNLETGSIERDFMADANAARMFEMQISILITMGDLLGISRQQIAKQIIDEVLNDTPKRFVQLSKSGFYI